VPLFLDAVEISLLCSPSNIGKLPDRNPGTADIYDATRYIYLTIDDIELLSMSQHTDLIAMVFAPERVNCALYRIHRFMSLIMCT
jgi:hypothetical protein